MAWAYQAAILSQLGHCSRSVERFKYIMGSAAKSSLIGLRGVAWMVAAALLPPPVSVPPPDQAPADLAPIWNEQALTAEPPSFRPSILKTSPGPRLDAAAGALTRRTLILTAGTALPVAAFQATPGRTVNRVLVSLIVQHLETLLLKNLEAFDVNAMLTPNYWMAIPSLSESQRTEAMLLVASRVAFLNARFQEFGMNYSQLTAVDKLSLLQRQILVIADSEQVRALTGVARVTYFLETMLVRLIQEETEVRGILRMKDSQPRTGGLDSPTRLLIQSEWDSALAAVSQVDGELGSALEAVAKLARDGYLLRLVTPER